MYFVSNRTGNHEIFRTTRASTNNAFDIPLAVGELNSTAGEHSPVLSQDELEIFFGSYRLHSSNDIFHARRLSTSDGFGVPMLVAELSGATSEDYPNWVSPDRCQLIFTSDREGGSGGLDLWIATRPQ